MIPRSTKIRPAEKSVWVRWLPNKLPAAGYITLKNSADQSFDIAKITSRDYKKITMYQTVHEAESARVVKLDKITVPAKGEFGFVPGQYHLMFENPTRHITPGDKVEVVFFLDNGHVFKVRMPVRTSPELY